MASLARFLTRSPITSFQGGFGEMSLGVYGVPGGYVELLGDWYPDRDSPDTNADAMLKLAQYYENTVIVLEEIAQAGSFSIEERFETQTDPDGKPWVALSDDYIKWKVQHGGPEDQILVLSGDLRTAATERSAWKIRGDTLIYDPSLPPYGVLHQTGTGTRRLLRRGETGPAVGSGKGKALPPRPFAGFDQKTIDEFDAIFATWVDKGLASWEEYPPWFRQGIPYTRPGGITQSRDILGRFGPKI